MSSDRIRRNDFILFAVFASTLLTIVLIMFAPVADQATFSMRVWALAESPISMGIVSTFIAAFAGTWGAQLLAERTAKRKELLSEIRGTNAALGLVFNIANTYIVTKKQHIRALVKDYEAQVAGRKAQQRTGVPFRYHLELRTITAPFSPIEGVAADVAGEDNARWQGNDPANAIDTKH